MYPKRRCFPESADNPIPVLKSGKQAFKKYSRLKLDMRTLKYFRALETWLPLPVWRECVLNSATDSRLSF